MTVQSLAEYAGEEGIVMAATRDYKGNAYSAIGAAIYHLQDSQNHLRGDRT